VASFGYLDETHDIEVFLMRLIKDSWSMNEFDEDTDISHVPFEDFHEYYVSFEADQVSIDINLTFDNTEWKKDDAESVKIDTTMPLETVKKWITCNKLEYWDGPEDKDTYTVVHQTVDGRTCDCFLCVESSSKVNFKNGDRIRFILSEEFMNRYMTRRSDDEEQ